MGSRGKLMLKLVLGNSTATLDSPENDGNLIVRNNELEDNSSQLSKIPSRFNDGTRIITNGIKSQALIEEEYNSTQFVVSEFSSNSPLSANVLCDLNPEIAPETDLAPYSNDLSDTGALVELRNVTYNVLNDAASRTSAGNIMATDDTQHSYTLKLNLRKVVKRSYSEMDDLEEVDPFDGEDSDEYVPESSEETGNISSSSSSSKHESLVLTSVSSKENDEHPNKKGKKRTRKPENWKKTKAKLLKNSGKSYTSRTGKIIKEKTMGSPCSDKCILSCFTKFSENIRVELFENYWKLASLQRQRDFLGSCIEPLQLKYRRVSMASKEPRRQNCAFYLLNNGKRMRVCKTFMIKTFGITERTMRTIIQSKSAGNGMVVEDLRGKHGRHPKIDKEILDSVRSHINSVPRIESHYLRASTSREFIDGGLSIAEMHRQYENARVLANKFAANYDTYARIFNTEFNIEFFAPKKDQCDICEAYKNAVGQEKERMESDFELHQEEKKLSRIEKTRDKENANKIDSKMVVAAYDLQAVLPVPMGQTSAFFYKSRLNCFNFTISELNKDHNVCYFWHEGLGNRGVNEIGTCVLQFLEEVATTLAGADIVFYSDNCGGQQKNRFMLGLYLYAVEKLKINSIEHKFLIRGHTQNEGDTLHSIIEKSVKKAKKSGPIYVPDQYISLIRTSKKKGNPLIVRELTYSDFLNLKLLNDEINFNCTKNLDGDNIKISDIKMFRFVKASEEYFYKTTYKQEDWEKAKIRIVGRRSSEARPLINISTKPAYSSKIPISENKKKDLLRLLEANIIPKFYEQFYLGLF